MMTPATTSSFSSWARRSMRMTSIIMAHFAQDSSLDMPKDSQPVPGGRRVVPKTAVPSTGPLCLLCPHHEESATCAPVLRPATPTKETSHDRQIDSPSALVWDRGPTQCADSGADAGG